MSWRAPAPTGVFPGAIRVMKIKCFGLEGHLGKPRTAE